MMFTTTSLIVVIILITFVAVSVQACLSPFKEEKYSKGIWNEKANKRRLADCDCGQDRNLVSKDKSWNVFIHSKTDPATGEEKICTGTIITSNLIITSHKCLTLKDKTMNIYDIWKPEAGVLNMVGKDGITVTEKINKSSGEIFKVEEIIYNSDYAFSSSLNKLASSDFALIRVSAKRDFTKHLKFRPICIPSSDFKETEIINQKAYYYGAAGKNSTNSILEVRNIDDGIQKRVDCFIDSSVQDETMDKSDVLCVGFETMSPDSTPEVEGGPLLINSGGSNFLIGIATKVGMSDSIQGVDFDFAYFSNIIPWIKYLEYNANKYGSKWCKSNPLQLNQKVPPRTSLGRHGPYPWEPLESSGDRDYSLDCVCGVSNSLGGRVVGGVTATPYEFGWMTLIYIHHNGRKSPKFLCGGSIINDRIILTAAHCFVADTKVHSNSKRLIPPVEDVDVTVNVHSKKGDSNGIAKKISKIIFHPEYPEPRKAHPSYYDYDVALIILEEPFHEFASASERGIRPICLPKIEENLQVLGKIATVAGWGLTNPEHHSSFADKLQKLEIPIINRDKCAHVATDVVTERFLCAGSLNRWKDAAGGDSGGPLMIMNDKNQWYQVGIVSWGEDVNIEGELKTAALYTDVQSVLRYIDYESHRVKAKWCKQS